MTKEEIIKAKKGEIEKLEIAINKSVKDIKPVDSTGIVLKNGPPTKAFLNKSRQK